MKFLILTNAMTNGGDFLVVDCGIKMVRRFLGEENCTFFNIYESSAESMELAQNDAVLYLGGPLYISRLLENHLYSIMSVARKYQKKFHVLGCGWYGVSDDSDVLYKYQFSEKSREILSYINENGILGCRDYLTVNVLKNNGYKNTVMTGCPAWYDNMMGIKKDVSTIKKVVISDMGLTKDPSFHDDKYEQFVEVLRLVKTKFPNAEIIFTFNNGIITKYSTKYNKKIEDLLIAEKIKYYDLSHNRDGFSVYDECDFHVGYRLHSHIYSLTKGIPSVLICEDGRGIGMNRTFGLPVIRANSAKVEGDYQNNLFLLKELEDGIDTMRENLHYEVKRINTLFDYFYNTHIKDYFRQILM